jgi:hypothetical protein
LKHSLAFIFGVAMCFVLMLPFTHVHAKPLDPTAMQTTSACIENGVTIACGQYVVTINTQRGFGRFVLYRVNGTPIDTSSYSTVQSGSSLGFQGPEPDPRGAYTFSLTAQEP